MKIHPSILYSVVANTVKGVKYLHALQPLKPRHYGAIEVLLLLLLLLLLLNCTNTRITIEGSISDHNATLYLILITKNFLVKSN